MGELLLVRHGETDWNREHRIQGHTDLPLNATGLEQARALAADLAATALAAVYSSDLARALQTATAVATAHRLAVRLDDPFKEKLRKIVDVDELEIGIDVNFRNLVMRELVAERRNHRIVEGPPERTKDVWDDECRH